MSLHDNFSRSSHPGFTRSIDPRSARRQLHVSFGIMAVLSLAIGGSAYAVRPTSGFDGASQRAAIASAAAVNTHTMNASAQIVVPGRS